MGKVIELPNDVVRKIAAGEVVERPASVVKELVENSLDANVRRIDVRIAEGGKERIEVIDDGDGMSYDDLVTAVKPHTTSKISRWEDLFALQSYGFRGEALYSIGTVSEMEIFSRMEGEESGQTILMKGGKLVYAKHVQTDKGTRVIVRKLFYNVPVRRKFLKSVNVESRMVIEMMQRFAIAHPNIHVTLIKDGEVVYNLPPSVDPLENIKMLFPWVKTDMLMELNNTVEGITIRGYISKPTYSRKNRLYEMCFVNNRYVRSGYILKAIEEGYGSFMEKGSFPFAIVFIDLPPEEVDVNVHPQKLEVKFSAADKVFGSVVKSIRDVLRTMSPLPFVLKSTSKADAYTDVKPTLPAEKQMREAPFPGYQAPSKIYSASRGVDNQIRTPTTKPQKIKALDFTDTRIIGRFKETYILMEKGDSLLVIDQHAAHERILYDEITRSYRAKRVETQTLMTPLEFDVESGIGEILRGNKVLMSSLGFSFEIEKNKIKIEAIPSILTFRMNTSIIISILNEIADHLRFSKVLDRAQLMKKIFSTIACKGAIKANEPLSPEEIRSLLTRLSNTDFPLTCPHGRPTILSIDLKEIQGHFLRT